jgi:hypothetical protein
MQRKRKNPVRKLVLFFIALAFIIFLLIIFDDNTGSIQIIVRDSLWHLVDGATVKLIPHDKNLSEETRLTRKDGIAQFYELKPGKYDLWIHCDLEIFRKENIKVNRYKSFTLQIEMSDIHSVDLSEEEEYQAPLTHSEKAEEEDRYIASWETFNKSFLIQQTFRSNHFVIFPSVEKDLYRSYIFTDEKKDNAFITTDLILHTAHIFFDHSLRIIELNSLQPLVKELGSKMIVLLENQYRASKNDKIKKLILLNIGFFSVAECILDSTFQPKSDIKDLIETDYLNTIEQQKIEQWRLLPYTPKNAIYAMEDYTQYIPRGHYTRNQNFKKYFKAMMWLSRMIFILKPGPSEEDLEAGRMMTLQALLITDALKNNKDALKNWYALDNAIDYFMGKSDDLGPEDYFPLLSEVFGANGSPDRFADRTKLDIFIQKAMKLRDPKILSGLSFTDEGMFQETSKGFSFLGQRSIPDGNIMQELVYSRKENNTILHYTGKNNPFTLSNDPNAGPIRGYPRGLDIMAVLGSDRALSILKQEGDTEYTKYDEQMKLLQKRFSGWKTAGWNRDLYTLSLYTLLPLLKLPAINNLPEVFKMPAWLDKELFTALGFWSELRHDTVLYAYQPYVPTLGFYPEPLDKLAYPSGFVEPYPDVYDRIRKLLIKQMIIMDELKNDNMEIRGKNEGFQKLLEKLIAFSKAENAGNVLSKNDYDYIQKVGNITKELKSFSPGIMSRIASGSDDRMDVIADVFTNPWEEKVLEEGVGSPMYIFVYINDAQGRRICRGMTYSYYEFKHPMNDRLSDEKWQRMGKQDNRPALPAWTKSFILQE